VIRKKWSFCSAKTQAKPILATAAAVFVTVRALATDSIVFVRVYFLCTQDNSWTAALSLLKFCTHSTISRTLLSFKVIGQRSRSHGFLAVFCVRDAAATRGQYLALSKAWWSCCWCCRYDRSMCPANVTWPISGWTKLTWGRWKRRARISSRPASFNKSTRWL